MPDMLTVVDHPLILHKLTYMRRKDTSTEMFRRRLGEIAQLLAYEVTRDLPLEHGAIETPIVAMEAPQISGKKLVPRLDPARGQRDARRHAGSPARRARGPRRPLPRSGHARAGRVLLQGARRHRRPAGHRRRPDARHRPLGGRGGESPEGGGRRTIKYVCLLAAPEGVAALTAAHPDVPIFTAAIDDHLNEHGYIIPGLGDAGDRLFGTK